MAQARQESIIKRPPFCHKISDHSTLSHFISLILSKTISLILGAAWPAVQAKLIFNNNVLHDNKPNKRRSLLQNLPPIELFAGVNRYNGLLLAR